MKKVLCQLRLGEVPLHLYQIIGGFMLLARQGMIELRIERLAENDPDLLPYNMMEARIDGVRVLYDANDGYDNLLPEGHDYGQWMDQLLASYDMCFKRSYSDAYNRRLRYKDKVYPLGLNYMVTVKGSIAHRPMPNDPRREKVKKLVRMLPFSEYYNGLYYPQSFEHPPDADATPRILLMARLWDVRGDYEGQIGALKQEERAYINEFRASCIRLCRKEFGDTFFGGVTPSTYARERYADVVLEDTSIAKRHVYLQKVKESPICIATMGLHQSIGWKFAEYVAASRAIVTEKLHYEVPGDFHEQQNYLVFQTPHDCVKQIAKLVDDRDARYNMMLQNYQYYREYVRADRLVLNSIQNVMERGGRSGAYIDRVYTDIQQGVHSSSML